MLVPVNKVDEDSQKMNDEQKNCANDLLRNAQSRGLNYAEKGFRQKLIDILYKLGYYKDNKTIFYNE